MDLELGGSVAVVTGAGKGIGLAVVRALAAEGAKVVAGARHVDSLEGIDGVTGVTGVAVDLVAADGPQLLIDAAVAEHGRVDVLVNNAGDLKVHLDGFLSTTDEDFESAMALNFFSGLRTIRAALHPMFERGEGAIVNVASVNAFFHPDGAVVDYGAAKAALLNVAKGLSQELGPQGVRINSVSPGPVETDLWLGDGGVAATVGAAAGTDRAAARAAIVAGMGGIPSGRFSTPQEVATLVTLLASPVTSNVTGANYVVDGGLIKTT